MAVGVAAFYAVEAIVTGLLFPIIAIFIGDSEFDLNSFSISTVEFKYGIVIEYLALFAVIAGIAIWVFARRARRDVPAMRSCPECAMSIPTAARRCPHCTAVLVG